MKALKRAIEHVLVRGGPAAVAARLHRGRMLVLAYHNVVPDDSPLVGDGSLHLRRRSFGRQLDVLARTCDVVPLAALGREAGSGGRPRVVITFDDAYVGALTLGLAELERRGLAATVFVAPAFVGGRSFWWDAFSQAGVGLEAGVRAQALALGGGDEAVRAWAQARGLERQELPEWLTVAGAGLLERAVSRGITLGSHSWSHPDLRRLSPDELTEELARPLQWLRERYGHAVVPWLAYPYGLESAAVRRACEETGYEGGFRVSGGWLPRSWGDGRLALPRMNVPAGLDVDGFRLRVAGLLGG
jgi:peptidoglycan/xylan/chitin deacetylase (PgdA/CDA1 family)